MWILSKYQRYHFKPIIFWDFSIFILQTILFSVGTVIREECKTESTSLTNYTDRISINLLNSTVDSYRIRNGVVGLMLSEMSNRSPSYNPYMQSTTPSNIGQAPGFVIVQPPAQYITVNSIPPYDKSNDFGSVRYERNFPSKFWNKFILLL